MVSNSDSLPNQMDVDEVNVGIAKVKSICEKVTVEIAADNIDPVYVPIFKLLNEAITGLCDNQVKIVNNLQGNTAKSTVNTVIISDKRPRQEISDSHMVDLRQFSQRPTVNRQVIKPPVDPQVKKFKDAVNDAEKSTLIFNLNLGKVPIINQDTMSTKVTKALSEKAAQKDGMRGSIPSEESAMALDDVLSVAKGMKFYGKSTKTYRNPKDQLSGSYCTIPVRYDFPDKETRAHAETVFRDKCKVQCSVPYPLILRETIKQVVDQTKSRFPGQYVKVNVDTGSMQLHVVRRPMLAEGDKSKKVWTYEDPIPIPKDCLDLSARSIPEGYKVVLPCPQEQVMETSSSSDDETSDASQDSVNKKKSPAKNGRNSQKKI
jgi:hypothetical protein